MPNNSQTKDGLKEIFCKFVVKDGKKIYPNSGRCFHFFVKV